MIVTQKLVEEIDSLIADEALVIGINEAMPGLLLEAAEDVVVLSVELNLVLVQIVEQVIRAQDLGYLDQLVAVRVAVEEGLFAEDHGCEHRPETPHVQAVVVLLEVNQELGPLKVAGSHAHIVFCARVVEFGQTPIDKPKLSESQRPLRWETGRARARVAYFSVLMVDHNVMRLHISVHDALAVAEVQRLQEL